MSVLSKRKVMKENDKILKINEKKVKKARVRKAVGKDEVSQKEIMRECRLELSMSDYSKLMRLAMCEGCSAEELVARQIARLVK